jgi:hypothetical protein
MAVARMGWIEYASSRGLPYMNDILIDHPEAMVRDGTAALEELNHSVTNNLREIGWAEKCFSTGQNIHGKTGPFLYSYKRTRMFVHLSAWYLTTGRTASPYYQRHFLDDWVRNVTSL